MKRINTDVLVVGGGGAGLMAAYEATKYNVRVSIVSKGKIQRSGATIMAPGAISGVDDRWKVAEDSRDIHLTDTLKGGAWINEQDKVKMLVEQSSNLIMELERMGAIFQRNTEGDKPLLRIDGGHSYHRCPYLEDRTGREMVRAMISELRKRDVRLYEEIMIIKVVKEGQAVKGALGFDLNNFEPVIFECKSVILATGGAGMVYANTDNSTDLTGDGYALALDAGVELKDMEFVQFYPIGLLFPPSLKGMLGGLLYYSKLYNCNDERFMEKYDPERLELSTRDRVSRAIMQEVQEGRGTPRGGVYCDLTFNEPSFVAKMTPALNATYLNIGIDPEQDRFEIAPTCHFFMGGIQVDNNWKTWVDGLYGAGEVVGGMHGGNRLSQNALAEILVSGVTAGKSAAAYAKNCEIHFIDPKLGDLVNEKLLTLLSIKSGIRPSEYRAKLRNLMWEHVGVFRSENSLRIALNELEKLEDTPVQIKNQYNYLNHELLEAVENENLTLTAKCIIKAAMLRTESRGAHFRSDYPQTNNSGWLKNIIITKDRDRLTTNCIAVELKHKKPEVNA
ncbi:Fumarate reductase flavoprotein subunit [Sporomusa silvacetica DSM 10669]|uniref:Fumarate reductase flavoprotein subunit n=1 Tax=Sporomusa silvacetica DSM 10669 TaxID=1123289 RepID=A0ABZ3IR31_9FIRM|nr:FAD-dependent oxidoreductase [Sporomusa silvacetica]OZC22871.1 fumarate reductase flavoprotein subunit [Sporomusa silvacetica DSM 10669]